LRQTTNTPVSSWAADLGAYPNLVAIYLGMRVYTLRGLWTVASLRTEVLKSVDAKPDGLLFHESFYFSLFPLHIGLRQYWRDFDSLERWTRALPHQKWWKDYAENGRGTGFWHETYLVGGRAEGIYDAMREPVGLLHFAGTVPASGKMSLARARLGPAALPSGAEERACPAKTVAR
jgi:hypothetical protein